MQPDELMSERMGRALLSEDGTIPNDGAIPNNALPSRDKRIMMSALQVLNALNVAQEFPGKCDAILRMRSVNNDDRADWCRSLAWHYGYVLRERARTFINNLRAYFIPLGKEHAIQTWLSRHNSDFKKRTDPHLSDRGKHVHNFEVDDPLVAQVRLLEIMSASGLMPQLAPLVKLRARRVQQHVKQQVAAHLDPIVLKVEQLIGESKSVWSVVFETMEENSKAA